MPGQRIVHICDHLRRRLRPVAREKRNEYKQSRYEQKQQADKVKRRVAYSLISHVESTLYSLKNLMFRTDHKKEQI